MKIGIKKGVTLIELLITIGIMSVLAVVLVTLINPAEMNRRSRDSKRISDLATIKRAIDMALSDKQLLTDTGGAIQITSTTDVGGLNISKYIPAIPEDPAYGVSGSVQVTSGGCIDKITVPKSSMLYEYKSDGSTYAIRSRLESASNCNSLNKDGFPSDFYELGTKLDIF